MNISDNVKNRKLNDRQQYAQAIRSMYDTVDKRHKHIFSGYEADGVESELNLILRYYQIKQAELPKDIPEEDRFHYILDAANIMSRTIQCKGKWWKEDAMPLFCKTKEDEKFHALIPGKFGGLYYYDTAQNKKVRVTERISEKFETEAVCFYRPMPETKMTAKTLLLFLMKTLSVSDYLFLSVITLLVTLLGLILPYVNQYIFRFVIPSGQKQDIPFVFALLFGVVLSSALFGLFRTIWMARIGDKIRNTAEVGLWNRILNLPPQFFKQYDAGELTERALMLGEICEVITQSIVPVLLSTVFSMVYLAQISTFSTKLILPVIVILFFMFGFSCLVSWFMIQTNRKENKAAVLLSGFAYQLFQSVGTLKTAGAEVRAFSKWAKLYGKKMKIYPNFFVQYAESFHTFIMMGGTILIYEIVFRNEISASVFISFQVAFGFLTGVMGKLSGIVTQMAYVKPAVQMIEPILAEKPEKERNKRRVSQLEGQIDVNNLCFRYSEELGDVIHNLSLSIKPGEYVAIVGSSGCGKSTLFRLLLGFEKPDRGAIYYDGIDLNELDCQSVRRRIGTVLQDGSLFAGDIFSNIALCAADMTMDEAWEAARQAGCDQDIENMPMGMFTLISDGGGGISGGQKQRILIARALAMKPDIMLFDEATSALDNLTQKRVVESLAKRNVTRIVIAHRLSTIKECDRIIYLDRGQVAEQGSYEELMKLRGKFYELAKYQLV